MPLPIANSNLKNNKTCNSYGMNDYLTCYNTQFQAPEVEAGFEEASHFPFAYSEFIPAFPLLYQDFYGCLQKDFYTPQKRKLSYQGGQNTQKISSDKAMQESQRQKKKAVEQDFRMKYKTEMCRNWEQKGHCEFSQTCAFAHGPQELRQKTHISTNYKTKKCLQYHLHGSCPYGSRCQFLHDTNTNKREGPVLSYTEKLEKIQQQIQYLINDEELINTQDVVQRKRLPTFECITNDSNDQYSTNASRSESSFNCDDEETTNRRRILSCSLFN